MAPFLNGEARFTTRFTLTASEPRGGDQTPGPGSRLVAIQKLRYLDDIIETSCWFDWAIRENVSSHSASSSGSIRFFGRIYRFRVLSLLIKTRSNNFGDNPHGWSGDPRWLEGNQRSCLCVIEHTIDQMEEVKRRVHIRRVDDRPELVELGGQWQFGGCVVIDRLG